MRAVASERLVVQGRVGRVKSSRLGRAFLHFDAVLQNQFFQVHLVIDRRVCLEANFNADSGTRARSVRTERTETKFMEFSIEELRRYLQLDRKRAALGLTGPELADWQKTKGLLLRHLRGKTPEIQGDESLAVTTRLKATFTAFANHRQTSLLTSLSRGGAFVNTAFAPEVGTTLDIDILEEGAGADAALSVPCQIVFNNIGDEFSVHGFGMGVRFGDLPGNVRAKLDALYERVFMQSWNAQGR